jgi:hypothetical protein
VASFGVLSTLYKSVEGHGGGGGINRALCGSAGSVDDGQPWPEAGWEDSGAGWYCEGAFGALDGGFGVSNPRSS